MSALRVVAVGALVAACAHPAPPAAPADPRLAVLERRVASLEARGSGAPDLTELTQRVDDLETLARESHALQQDIQQLVGRLADRAAGSPAPVAATPRGELLDPQQRYRIAIAGSPALGPDAAAVTIVAAIQMPERYTHALWPALRALRAKYGDDVRVIVQGFVANAPALATTIGACAAAHFGADALDKVEDALWTARELAQTDATKPWPDADDARAAASGAGIDLKAYDARVTACGKSVDREQRALALVGQTAAPTLWINGRPIVGAQPVDRLAAIVDDELARARADRARGGAARTYYDRLMKAALPSAR